MGMPYREVDDIEDEEDEEDNCLLKMQLDVNIHSKLIFAEKHDESITFVYGKESNKKIFTITHAKPRKFLLPENI